MIDTVLINWKRPDNIPIIIDALNNQTIKNNLYLIDVSPGPEFDLDKSIVKEIPNYFRWKKNYWAFNRFIISFAFHSEYVCFLDDDLVPGRKMLENYLNWAEKLKDFGVLGQKGREFKTKEYPIKQTLTAETSAISVDSIIQNYFLKTENLFFLYDFMLDCKFDELAIRNDDLSLCLAMQRAGLKNYVIPADSDSKIDKMKLPEPYAFFRLPDHLEKRNEFLQKFWLTD